MKKFGVKDLTLMGLSIALVTVSTMLIQVPVPATSGYIHLGDAFILIISAIFGPVFGLVAGGIGSGLADLLSGYAHWAPFTLVIKAAMGFVMGYFCRNSLKEGKLVGAKGIIGGFLASLVMIIGYLLGGTILKSSFEVALTSVPSNCIQGFGGYLIYILVAKVLEKVDIKKLV